MANDLMSIAQGGQPGVKVGMPTLNELAPLLQTLQGAFAKQGQVETANVGGTNLLVDRSGPDFSAIVPTLAGLAQQADQQRQEQSRQKFMTSIETIMSSNSTPEVKINNLMKLKVQHGTDYDLGIDDIVDQFNQQADRSAKKQEKEAKESTKITKIDKLLGEITTGGRDVQGVFFDFKDEKEARDHAIRTLGPKYAEKFPEVETLLSQKYGPDTFGFRVGEVKEFQGKKWEYLGNNQWQRAKNKKR